jgi:hypothetical protein
VAGDLPVEAEPAKRWIGQSGEIGSPVRQGPTYTDLVRSTNKAQIVADRVACVSEGAIRLSDAEPATYTEPCACRVVIVPVPDAEVGR